MPNVYTHESVATQFTEIAGRLEQFAHRPLASREGFIAAQQAGTLLGAVIEQGLIKVPDSVKKDCQHFRDTPVTAQIDSVLEAWLHPAVCFFYFAIDRWLGDALPGMVRLEPGGLSHFDNTQLDDEEDQDLWAGRLRTMAGACRVLADLIKESDEEVYHPAQWFTLNTNISPSRLRQATRSGRKSKRVRKKTVDGVECYSLSDATQWWPQDMKKA